jgi:hypothetical protein
MSQTRRAKPGAPSPATPQRFRKIAPERVEKAVERLRQLSATPVEYPPEMTKPASTKQSRQAEREVVVTLRLPRELHGRLKELAGERGLTAQIRDRLDASFLPGTGETDPKTRDVVRSVAEVAQVVADYYGEWHTDPFAFEVFKRTIVTVLEKALVRYRPNGEPVPKPNPAGIANLIFEDDVTAEEVADVLTTLVLNELFKGAKP